MKIALTIIGLIFVGVMYAMPWLSCKTELIKNDTDWPYWLRKIL